MSSSRKYPFGYKIEFGKIVIEPKEAETVKFIFSEYSKGSGYLAIANKLNNGNVSYIKGKQWNRNMINRILCDERYIGKNDYPALVSEIQFEEISELRASKPLPMKKSRLERTIRFLSGKTLKIDAAPAILEIINNIIAEPEIITAQHRDLNQLEELTAQRELAAIVSQETVDEAQAKELIFKLASAQYGAIGNSDYETARLQRIFSNTEPMKTLEPDLLRDTVSAIAKGEEGRIVITLKNGQVFMEGAS